MTDTCDSCGAPVIQTDFDEVADLAFDAAKAAANTILAMRQEQWPEIAPNELCHALLSGFLSASVAVGFSLTRPDRRDTVMDYLRDYLPIARENLIEPDEAPEGTLQ